MHCSNCGKNIPFAGKVGPYCHANKEGDQQVMVIGMAVAVVGIVIGYAAAGFCGSFGGGMIGGVVGAIIGTVMVDSQNVPKRMIP
jgi:hypothetical protein